MAAAGEPAKAAPNSYLNQFLSRQTAPDDADDEPQDVQAVEDTTPNNGIVNTDSEGIPCPGGRLNDDHHDHHHLQFDDGNMDAIPRSPPRPTPQPPAMLPGGLRWSTLDSSAILDTEDGPGQVTMLRRDLDASSRHNGCGVSSGHSYGVRDDGHSRRGPQPLEQGRDHDFMVDEEDMLQPGGGRGGASARTYGAIAAASSGSRVHQQQEQEATGFVGSSSRRNRPERGSSKLVPELQPDYQQRHTGNGNNSDGRALSVRESSALFWEESESLEAKSGGATNDFGLGIARGRGATASAVAAAGVGGGAASFRRGRAPTVAVGRGQGPGARGSRVDVRITAAAAVGIGGSSRRRKRPRRGLEMPQLPLGQALRTVGGLLGGDGAKMSAVGKHITSLEGVPPGVSSRTTQLFLSNNSLRSLHGLEAFSCVACLSLSHNLMRRTEDLLPLASLPRLETLSLEGSPVCGAANYRAHAVSLAPPCLRALDRTEVTAAETSDAPAIVAAERSATGKTSRERFLCWVLNHMSGLLECHAELRDSLLWAGGGGGGGGYGGVFDRVSSRLRWGGGVSAGRRAWRQRPAVAMPVYQMLAVLRAESWPAFDQPEAEELERRTLDEAAELFAEVVTGRRSAGQRTHELTDGAAATLDSPATRVWAQVLGEVQRRTEGDESDIVLRCEGVRRREAERFRRAPAQTTAFLQELAASVGCSDSQWSVLLPRRTTALPPAAVVRRTAASTGSSKTPLSPLPPPGPAHSRGEPSASRRVTEVCAAAQIDAVVKKASDGEGPQSPQPEPAGLDCTGPDDRHDPRHAGGGYCAANADAAEPRPREKSEQEVEAGGAAGDRTTERGRLPSSGVGCAQGQQEECGDKDEDDGPRGRLPTAGSPEPVALAPQQNSSALSSAPSERGAEAARGGAATTASAPLPAAATMASAAKVLLARAGTGRDQGRSGSTSSPSPPRPRTAQPQGASSKRATNATGGPGPFGGEVVRENRGGRLRRTNDGEEGRAQPRGGLEEGAAADRDKPNGRGPSSSPPSPPPPRVRRHRTRESPARHESGIAPLRALPGGESEEAPRASAGSPTTGAPASTLTNGGSPAAGQRQTAVPQSEGVRQDAASNEAGRRRTAGYGDGEDGGGADGGGTAAEDGSSSEATRRLLREALRVKRLLAGMDREDAAGSSAVDSGLRDEDPDRFLARLGLVEIKPLSARLVEALDRAPQAAFADPSAAVPEPRTTRGLREQVAALGKEVIQRAEACAEARKLHAALRKQVEVARRTRARNLDTVDVACRTLVAKAGDEVKVLRESRRVAHEAERYHATLARLQEQVEATIGETRKIVSRSEAVAWQLREEMEGRGGELSDRRRFAEQGLADWEQAADNDPAVHARRRAYDCEILVLRHRMGCDGANSSTLAAAFRRLRARAAQQRRARDYVAMATARRDAVLVRSAFDALARGSRSRAAAAAAAAARCRAGLAAWRRAAAVARGVRVLCWRRERAIAVRGLRRWRQRSIDGQGLGDGFREGAEGRKEALQWRLELFRERRAKRLVFRAWRTAAQTAAAVAVLEAGTGSGAFAGSGGRRHGERRRRGFSRVAVTGRDELTAYPGWGARLRTAEALARRRRSEVQIGLAFRWWRRHRQSNALARTAGLGRALRRWRGRVSDARSKREATLEARGSYVVSLGRRVLAAWSAAAASRARRRAGAALLVSALAALEKRTAFRRWASQAAAATRETDDTVAALEHCYARRLRGHLRAWSALARDRRALRRGVELLLRGRRVSATAAGLRLWRRQAARVRDAALRKLRIKAWAAAAARRRRLAALSLSFAAWAAARNRVAAIHRVARLAAARRRRLALAGGFRALCLSGRRRASTAAAVGDRPPGGEGEGAQRALVSEAAVREAAAARAAVEAEVGRLRARLAQEKARALERHAAAREVAGEVVRSERERTRYARVLRRQVGQQQRQQQQQRRQQQQPPPSLSGSSTSAEEAEDVDGCIEGEEDGARGGGGEEVVGKPSGPPGKKAMGSPEPTEREGRLFGKLQAETLELWQRAAAARKQEERLRAEAAQKSAATTAALESALAEGRRLRAEAEQRKAVVAQLDQEARHAAAQAAVLSDRLAGAEQELGFEAARNKKRLREKDEGNVRARAAAAAAATRVADAEKALRRKGREVEELRARCAREGVVFRGKSGGGRRGGSGVGGGGGGCATGLEYRVFAAAVDARASAERCAVAAAERRVAAGTVLAEALRGAGSEAETHGMEVVCSSDDGDDGDAGEMAEARRLVADSVASERRQVAGLVLRRAEAKLRRSADLSLRASLDHRPLANPRSLLAEEAQNRRDNGGVTAPRRTPRKPATVAPAGDDDGLSRGIAVGALHGVGGDGTAESEGVKPRGSPQAAGRKDDGLDGTARTTPLAESPRPSSPGSSISCPGRRSGGERGSDNNSSCDGDGGGAIGEPGGSDRLGRRRNDRRLRTGDYYYDGHGDEARSEDGLKELKREISDLEGKIMGRLGGSGVVDHDDDDNDNDDDDDDDDDGPTVRKEPSHGRGRKVGNSAIAVENNPAKSSSARGTTVSSRHKEVSSRVQLLQQHHHHHQQRERPPVAPPGRAAAGLSSSLSSRRSKSAEPPPSLSAVKSVARGREARMSLGEGITPSGRRDSPPTVRVGRARRRRPKKAAFDAFSPACSLGSRRSWEGISAISSGATSASGSSRIGGGGSGRGGEKRADRRPKSIGARLC